MATTIQELIEEKLSKKLGASIKVRQRELEGYELDRRLFIQSIELLVEIDDRQQFMMEELGVDLVSYEEKFFRVIENLFYMAFSPEQIRFIEKFVYDKPKKDTKKLVTLRFNGDEERKMPFNTPEDLWEIIQIL